MDKLEFPADMPEHIRQLFGTPTADINRAWQITQRASEIADYVHHVRDVYDRVQTIANAYDAHDRQPSAPGATQGEGAS